MPDLPIDRLGPFPILQFAAALLVIGGLAYAVWKGNQERKRASPSYLPGEQQVFFEGPLAQTMNTLRDIKNHQARLVELNEEAIEAVRHQTSVMHDIKNELDFISRTRK